ncbi:hypothetical protein MF628_07995 [Paenibacillus polymyxa]|uniref:hypothetical protein n=1 Tax=Paenibacillus polymyxa TaxID=1406 RepID=UPI0020240A09|nr:hypothetical protein [Paenibacillus polymyxa]WDZ63906.1 hypothetical protein MF628_07995 [Paenibacillus polymyxa]
MKLTKCIVELERIYGVRDGSANLEGNNQHTYEIGERNYFTHQKTQTDIAQELNITKQQLHNYKKLLTLISELQDMVEGRSLRLIVLR